MNSRDPVSRPLKYEKHGYLIAEICQSYPNLNRELEKRMLEFRMQFPVKYRDWYYYELVPAIKNLQQRHYSHSTTPESFSRMHHNGYHQNFTGGAADQSLHSFKSRDPSRREMFGASSRSQSRIIQGESPGETETDSCYKKFDLPHTLSKIISNRCVLVGQGKRLSAALYPVNIPQSQYVTNLEHLKELAPFEDKKSFYEYLQGQIDGSNNLSEKLLYQLVLLHLKLKAQTESNDISELLLNEYRRIQGDQFLTYKRCSNQSDSSSRSHVTSHPHASRDSLSSNTNDDVMSREQFISQPQDSFSTESLALSREQFISQDLAQNQEGMTRDEFISQDQTQENFSNPGVMTRDQFISQDQSNSFAAMSREQFISQDRDQFISQDQNVTSNGPAMTREQYMSAEDQVMLREQFISRGSRNSVDSQVNSLSLQSQDEDKVLHRLRKLLLNGSKVKALQWAIENREWVSALFIASSIDEATFSSVSSMYIESIPRNDPLRTCLQVQFGLDIDYQYSEDWGIHLAAILNNSPSPDLILRFSKILSAVKDIYGQHFCYISARIEPGSSTSSSKYVLLGTENSSITEHVPIKNVILTMAYDNTLPHVQHYKYYLALNYVKMGAYGLSLSLLQNIANVFINKTRDLVSQRDLMTYVYDLSLRLYSRESTHHVDWINSLAELIQSNNVTTTNTVQYEQAPCEPQVHMYSEPPSYSYTSPENELTNTASQQESLQEPVYYQQSSYNDPQPSHQPEALPTMQDPDPTMFPSQVEQTQQKQRSAGPSFYVPSYNGNLGGNVPSYNSNLGDSQLRDDNNSIYQNQNQENLPSSESGTSQPSDLGGISQPSGMGGISMQSRFTFAEDKSDAAQYGANSSVDSSRKENKPSAASNAKPQQPSDKNKESSGSSWLSFLKFAKPKNQMILPDDKKPSIVWDSDKKMWVDVTGDGDSGPSSLPPPPKSFELPSAGPQSLPSQSPPSSTQNNSNYSSMQSNPMPAASPPLLTSPMVSNPAAMGMNSAAPNIKMNSQNGARRGRAKYVNVWANNS